VIPAIRDHLRSRWSLLRPGAPALDGAILSGADRGASSKVAIIYFDSAGQPAVVAKVARTSASEQALIAENAALRHLRSRGCEAVLDHAPEPLLLERIGHRLVLVMTAVPGRPMLTDYHTPGHTGDPDRVAADLSAAGTWLQRFHRGTQSGTEMMDAQTFQRSVGDVFERYRREIGWSEAEEELLHAITERARGLRGTPLPITGVHGDYWMGNLLVDDGVVRGVIDWELARPSGVCLADVYKFPTSYGFYLDRATARSDRTVPGHPGRSAHLTRWSRFGDWRNLPGFGYTYFADGWFSNLARQSILDHLATLGIPPAVNGVFFPTFLAEQATILDDPEFRQGYRSLLLAFAAERSTTWLWTDRQVEVDVVRGGASRG
jgi:aminoglycoside phosphotransferase (APT) family kinase protein